MLIQENCSANCCGDNVLSYLRRLPDGKAHHLHIRMAVNVQVFNRGFSEWFCGVSDKLSYHKAGAGAAGKKGRATAAIFFFIGLVACLCGVFITAAGVCTAGFNRQYHYQQGKYQA